MYSKFDDLQKDLPTPYFGEIYDHGTNFPRVNSLDIVKLLKQIKMFLLNLGFRKYVAVSVNKKLKNKSSSYNVFLRFQLFHFTAALSGSLQRRIQNAVEHLLWNFFAKIVNGFQLLTIFAKKSFTADFQLCRKYASDLKST